MKLLGSRGIQILKCETVQKFCHTSALNKILLEMPRENKHAAALRNHRTKMKEKNSRYSPGTVNLQVLGSGAQGAPRSLYLFTDQSRF